MRRLLATMITVATVSAGVAATFGGTVQAAPVVTHLEGDDAAPRFAVDVSDDGRRAHAVIDVAADGFKTIKGFNCGSV